MADTILIKRGTTEPTAGVLTVGELALNTGDGNLYTKLDDGTVSNIIGKAQRLTSVVRNETGTPITAFKAVYISGAQANKALVSLAQANAEATSSKTFGVTTTAIGNNSNGEVVCVGILEKVDTSTYPAGSQLWLSPSVPGGFTTTAPSAPDHAVFIGTVVYQHAQQGKVEVRIQNGYELAELHNVKITSVADGDIIAYNAYNLLYENKTAAALGLLKTSVADSTYLSKTSGGLISNGVMVSNVNISPYKPSSFGNYSGAVEVYDTSNASVRIYGGGIGFPDLTNQTTAYPGSSGFLLKADNLSGLGNTATARTNLGLGTMATATATDYATIASPSLTGNVTITANSTSPALSVIQTGTGDVIQLRDVASDTTYSFVDQNGKINTVASQTATAGFRIPSGSAPTTPVAGDFWNASGSLYLYHGTTAFQIPSLNASAIFTGSTFSAGQVASGNAIVNLATQNQASGASKTIAIGTSGLSGSTTTINVGSGTAGTSTIEIGSTGGTSTTNLRGTVTATTQATSDNSTKVATTAFVKNQPFLTATTGISSNVGGSGGTEIGYIQLYNNGVAGSEIFLNPYAYDFATATYQVIELSVTEPDPVNASYFTTAIQGKGIRFPDGTIQTTAGIGDAPADGTIYGRQNNSWVVSGGGTSFNGGTVTNPIVVTDTTYSSNVINISANDGTGVALISITDGLDTTSVQPSSVSSNSITANYINAYTALGINGNAVATESWVSSQGYLTSAPVTSVAGKTGAVSLSNTDISGLGTMATQTASNYASIADLGNGNATAGALVIDALKNANAPSSTNQFATEGDVNSAVNALSSQVATNYATKASPALTGTPTAPTAANGTNTTQIATTAFVASSIPTNNVKAWVNFNGTGTVAIRASMNVSSITDNGVGDYTVNFTTALADANYAVSGVIGETTNSNDLVYAMKLRSPNTAQLAGSVRIGTNYAAQAGPTVTNSDFTHIGVTIIR